MKPELAIITTEFLKDFINESMKKINWDGKYSIYSYNSFKDIPEIYNSIPDRVQGIITSGSFPEQVIKLSFPESNKIIRPFNNDNNGLYKLFLQILYHNKNIELNRIYADLLDIGNINIYEYVLGKKESDISVLISKEIEKNSLKQLLDAEEKYTLKHLEMWKNGQIDISITRFSSIMYKLQDAGLPVYFAYPSLPYLENICISAAHEITINTMRENLPSAILINPAIENGANNSDGRKNNLLKSLKRLRNVIQTNYLIQEKYGGYEIITDRKTVHMLTDGFSVCKIQDFLKPRLDFNVYIGYGISSNLHQARINAVAANREASLSPNSSSCLIDEENKFIFSLNDSESFVISRNVPDEFKKLSEISGLSVITLQKILSVVKTMENNRITSEEMSTKLAITQRSANRFLSSLKSCGLAKVVEQRQSATKGRPSLVYEVSIDYFNSEILE